MLKIIQGDVFEFSVCFGNVPLFAIQKVEFASKDLGVFQSAELYKGRYSVRIEGERTKCFSPGFARYDLTLTLVDGQKLTVCRNERIEVLEKVNEVKNE